MTFSARSPLKKMSWDRGQSSAGWAAFDLKQRQKNNVESELNTDPFPPIGTSELMGHGGDKLIKKKHVPVKSFSSVLLPDKSFPSLKEGGNSKTTMFGSDTLGKFRVTSAQNDVSLSIKKLKEQHHWAEISLIEDVLTAVDNNVDKASTLLETMVSSVNIEECQVSSNPGPATSDDIPCNEKTDKSLGIGKFKDDVPFCSSLVSHLIDEELEDTKASSDQKLSEEDNLRCSMGLFDSVPVEPEWEEDDIYISHRKDALKAMRSALRHSRAATNAFMRGDHFSAQQHSAKAQEDWHTAGELNSKAATEILSIRNHENDIWRLDLHGLHATEAIQALQDHLNKIESQAFSNGLATSNGVKENGVAHSFVGSFNFMDRENFYNQQGPLRLRSFTLDVITGIGNHSRGQASLPSAVRNFLNENRYRYEETRPGVITVWPKFRQS
ncbi:hypothetical protein RIF29_29750 [Crotalaria pallida]|uniref:Smr domain-containing protein n=1 Tax=Crotalaria pallida TaxID=3830 RepID=A0AAN9EG05_CROPI